MSYNSLCIFFTHTNPCWNEMREKVFASFSKFWKCALKMGDIRKMYWWVVGYWPAFLMVMTMLLCISRPSSKYKTSKVFQYTVCPLVRRPFIFLCEEFWVIFVYYSLFWDDFYQLSLGKKEYRLDLRFRIQFLGRNFSIFVSHMTFSYTVYPKELMPKEVIHMKVVNVFMPDDLPTTRLRSRSPVLHAFRKLK